MKILPILEELAEDIFFLENAVEAEAARDAANLKELAEQVEQYLKVESSQLLAELQ